MKTRAALCGLLAAATLVAGGGAHAAPAPATFVYQGELSAGGTRFNGTVDLMFTLFDAAEGGNPVTVQAKTTVPVVAGRFTASLQPDPPALGTHAARFVQLAVRATSADAFTVLTPRVALRPAPLALATTRLRDGSVDGDAIMPGAVAQPALATGAVGAAAVADAAVGTSALANAAVTGAAVADGSLAIDRFALVFPSQLGAVLAGSGLSGGGSSGSITLMLDTDEVQRRVTGICPLGESVAAFNADGNVLCEPLPGATLVHTVDSAGDVGMYSQIVISHGLPAIAARAGTGSVRLIRCGNRACSPSAPSTVLNTFSTNGPIFVDMATNPDGDPLIAWRREGAGLTVVRCNPDGCDNPLVIEQFMHGTHPSIGHPDPGQLGVPVMVYTDKSGIEGDLKFTRCGSLLCTNGFSPVQTIQNGSPKVGAWNAMAFDAARRPMISYYSQDASALRFARCADALCSTPPAPVTLDSPATNDVGTYTDIALSSAGQPMISYHDATAGSLRYALCLTADCTGTVLLRTLDDPAGNVVGQHTSIARGADNMPIISYYDATAGNLKVAHCSNTACNPATGTITITVVDDGSGNDAGQWSSLAIGDDGLPIISYYVGPAKLSSSHACMRQRCDSGDAQAR